MVDHQSKALASTTTPAACISVTLDLDESIYVFLSEEIDGPLTYVFQICAPRSDDVHHSENVLGFFLVRMRVIMIVIVIVAMVMGVPVVVVLLMTMTMTMMVLAMAMIMVRLTTLMAGMVMRMAMPGGRRSCIIKPEFRHRITNHTSQSADSR